MLPLLLMKCAKQDQCLETYDFQVFSDISPKSSALSLGDTLSFSMITDNTAIFDSFGYRSVNYPNFDPMVFFLMPILSDGQIYDGFENCEFIIDAEFTASIMQVDTVGLGLFFTEIDTTVLSSKIKVEFVLNFLGKYALYVHPNLVRASDLESTDFPERCRNKNGGKTRLNVSFFINDSIVSNSEILNESENTLLDNYWLGSEGSRQLSSVYYFKVEE